MIFEQIKKLKQHKEITQRYSESEDLDTESLLDLIPDNIKQTKYLSSSSLHFDRLRLTTLEETKFNKKFKIWLKSLVVFGQEDGYDYLLDFLLRKYHIQKYNETELLFITLPFPRFYTNKIRKFEFLEIQEKFSTEFIADCCTKYVDFLYFVIDYFDYYEHLKSFLNEVFDIFLSKNIKFLHKYIDALNEIKEKCKNEHFEFCTKIDSALDGKFNVYKIINIDRRVVNNSNYNLDYYNNNTSRELLRNLKKLKNYIVWLKENNYTDKNITKLEFKILDHILFGNEDFVIENDFDLYCNLLKDLENQEDVSCVISSNFLECLHKILYTNFREKLLKASYSIYSFYSKEDVLKILNKNNFKNSPYKDYDILVRCMEFANFDPKVFTGLLLSQSEVNELFDRFKGKNVCIANLKYYCEVNKIHLEDVNIYKSYSEENIEFCKDFNIIMSFYKKDKEVIKKITDFFVIKSLCDVLGYKEVLDNFDTNIIKNFLSQAESNFELLRYIIDRYPIEDILDYLKNHITQLIHFVEHDKFKKIKVIIQEFMISSTECKYIYNIIFDNFSIYKDHLDLLLLYKKEYNFINEFKDKILENCTDMLDVMDFYISHTYYEDIRIINKISACLIKKQKRSILVLFNRYGNIMIPHLEEFIKTFNFTKDYKKDMSIIKLNSNLLLQYIVKYDKLDVYEYQIIQMLKIKKDVDLNIFSNPEISSSNLLYACIKYKFINSIEIDICKFVDVLYKTNLSLFLKLTKYYTSDIKDIYFNIILEEKRYDMINKHFSCFNIKNEDLLYEMLVDYYNGGDIETEFSIVSYNSNNIMKLNKYILNKLDTHTDRSLALISKCIDNNKKYDVCHKDIHQAILLLLDSRDETTKKLSRKIYDNLIK